MAQFRDNGNFGIFEKSYADNSAALGGNEISGNSALGANALVAGINNQANGHQSFAKGISSRTGNPARAFTCAVRGLVLTYSGIDVSAEYYVASGSQTPNIIIGYFSADPNPSVIAQWNLLSVAKTITKIQVVNGNTLITIDSPFDDYATSGVTVDPQWGSFAEAGGLNCIAKGVGSRATGQYATANGNASVADGVQVTAKKQLSKAEGFGAISENFNEQTQGAPNFSVYGDNQKRVLQLSALCLSGSQIQLTLDNTNSTYPGAEQVTIPDNSVCNVELYLTAYQGNNLVVNFGDCWTQSQTFGLKKKGGVLTYVGGGSPVIGLNVKDGAAGWVFAIDISGTQPLFKFTGQNQVYVQVELVIRQVANLN